MDGEPVAKLSIAPRSRDDARIAAHLDTFARRVEATPPGMCPLAVQLTCMNMKLTTLPDIYRCLLGTGGEQITLPDEIMAGAGRCIRRMVELGG